MLFDTFFLITFDRLLFIHTQTNKNKNENDTNT